MEIDKKMLEQAEKMAWSGELRDFLVLYLDIETVYFTMTTLYNAIQKEKEKYNEQLRQNNAANSI